MKIINKLFVAISIAICGLQSNAAYEVIINVPEVNMIKMIKIVPHDPLVGDWINKGEEKNCSAWTPNANTITKNQIFEQTSTCSQEQTRTIEQQVKNLDTGVITKTGESSEELQTISVTKKQSATGTKATVKQCVYGSTWGNGFWLEKPDNTVYFIWYGPSSSSGEHVSRTLPNLNTLYTEGGYTYSRGNYNSTSGVSGKYYYICRE